MAYSSDDDIIKLLQNKRSKDEGFSLLMEKYKQKVYWHIRRMLVVHEDAEDVMQETFINIYRFSDKFKGESSLYTWIYRIASNECLRHFRDKKLTLDSLDDSSSEMISVLKSEVEMTEDEMLLKFKEAILTLPRKQQLVFNMRYYDEMSYEDIAQVLESSVATLKTNYHYAAEKIKSYLQKN